MQLRKEHNQTMRQESLSVQFNPHHTRLVLQYAIGSRLLLICLICLWRSLLSPYDTSASINPGCLINRSDPRKVLLPGFAAAFEESIVWDSVYFVRIVQCGYEYEQTYAFLPLLPISLSLLSRTVFAPLIPIMGQRAVFGFSGYVLSNITFILSALYLYRYAASALFLLLAICFPLPVGLAWLSVIILKDAEVSLRASILFCFNPASIFYSSIYSESLYALLSIGGLYYFSCGHTNFATIWLALSGCARSNGVLNAGYICFQTMHRAYDAIFLKWRAYLALKVLVAGALRCLLTAMPFICFQAYGYYNMCWLHPPDEVKPWCKARLPLLYNFIQSHYWGVGFLRYFQVKQLPNFLLASPILYLSLCSVIHYVKLWPETFLSLGFRALSVNKETCGLTVARPEAANLLQNAVSKKSEDQTLQQRKKAAGKEQLLTTALQNGAADRLKYTPVMVLPYVLHLGFMVATAFFVMHVQVSTRFLSASPPIYWFASYIMASPGIDKKWGYLIWVYCACYIFLGSLLFSNFYPFT